MLTKTEMALKNLRKNHARANSQQRKTTHRHVKRPQKVRFRRVAL